MSAHGFTSAFASELDAYLTFKEKMGFYGANGSSTPQQHAFMRTRRGAGRRPRSSP